MTEKRNIICVSNVMFGTVLLIQVQWSFQIGHMPEIGAESSYTGSSQQSTSETMAECLTSLTHSILYAHLYPPRSPAASFSYPTDQQTT